MDDADGFETYTNKTSTGNDIVVTLHRSVAAAPRPTALLLGWYASSRRNLGKYAALYRRMGYHTVQAVAPTSVVFSLSQRSGIPYVLSVLRVLAADPRLLAGGLVIAPFSNGGAILCPKLSSLFTPAPPAGSAGPPGSAYAAPASPSSAPLLPASAHPLAAPLPRRDAHADPPATSLAPLDAAEPPSAPDAAAARPAPRGRPRVPIHPDVIRDYNLHADDLPVVAAVRSAVAAIVLDSCPCYMHYAPGARAIASGLGFKPGSFMAYLVFIGFVAMGLLQKLLYGNMRLRFWMEMRHATYPCPELYMYSTADELLDEHALDELVAYRRKVHPQGANGVHVWRVEDAAHVALYVSHKEAYLTHLEGVNEWGVNSFRKSVGLGPWDLPNSESTVSQTSSLPERH